VTLFYATSTRSRQERDRLAIIRTLLEAGTNVDECYAEIGFNTPLMNAITLIFDIDIVKELLRSITNCKGCDWTNSVKL
jgi:hypothetical protein